MKKIETKDDFKQFLDDAGQKLVVVDFYADWCGPCKMIAPKLVEMENEYSDVLFAKVNVDENEEVGEEQEITAMPTFLFFKGGKRVADLTGANETLIRELIKEHK